MNIPPNFRCLSTNEIADHTLHSWFYRYWWQAPWRRPSGNGQQIVSRQRLESAHTVCSRVPLPHRWGHVQRQSYLSGKQLTVSWLRRGLRGQYRYIWDNYQSLVTFYEPSAVFNKTCVIRISCQQRPSIWCKIPRCNAFEVRYATYCYHFGNSR